MAQENGLRKEGKSNRLDIRWDDDLLNDVRGMAKLTGKSAKEVVQNAVKVYLAKEKPRLAKLAKLRAQLLPS